ncbi:hypothetical protein [Hydrogenophilus thermoluteolus]|uniref:hypothetical protein n=1 Tax=Hydrogenophilus thermoluteolus TaxID=297 RepID=UPI003F680E81
MATQRAQALPFALGWQPIEQTAAHGTLREHATRWRAFPIREQLQHDRQRVSALTWHVGDWHLDLSKQAWDVSVLQALLDLTHATALPQAIAALFAGEPVNLTERRAALHMAYRGSAQPPAAQRDRFVSEETRLAAFVATYRSGALEGFSGAPSTPWSISASVAPTLGRASSARRSPIGASRATARSASSRTSTRAIS